MKRLLALALLTPCLWMPDAQEAKPSRLHFAHHGYAIDALEGSSGSNHHTLSMLLPPRRGFAPNVNVRVQAYPNSIEDYLELSRGQFETLEFRVHSTNVEGDVATFEYSGSLQGRALHFYARAIKEGEKVWLVTATAAEEDWKDFAERLVACTDSFTLDDDVVP